MLKNWVVTTQVVRNQTDGVMAREKYLQAINHPNHKNTESIISLIGDFNTSQRIALAGEKFRLHQKLHQRKGGRPLTSYAVEFCLTLPKGYRPTPKQWQAIVQECCVALAKMLELTPEEWKQYKSRIRAVLHQKPQSEKNGSGDHVHLIISKTVGNRVLKKLQQKVATQLIKQAFNTAVLKHVGIDHKDYKPHELNRGKRLEEWKYHHQKAKKESDSLKLLRKIQNQADKWFQAWTEQDDKQQNRQLNRLIKSFSELSKYQLSSGHHSKVNKLKQDIETKSGLKIP